MSVHVIRVETIPFGVSVLVDEKPGSLVVWLLESEWPEEIAGLLEQVLVAVYAGRGASVTAALSGLHTV